MFNNFLILIPVNKFRESLIKTVKYYLEFDCNIVIVDSSRKKINFHEKRVKIEHYPDLNFYQKIHNTLSKYPENNILLSPDDDVINISEINYVYNDFVEDKNVALVFGQVMQTYESQKYKIYARPFLKRKDINKFRNIYKKIDYHCFNYDLLLWSLYKKDFLLDCMNDLINLNLKNDNFIELVILFNLINNGGYLKTKNFWLLRNIMSSDHWGSRHNAVSENDVLDINKFIKYYKKKYKIDYSYYFINKFIKSSKLRILKYKYLFFIININIIPIIRYFKITNKFKSIKNYLSY